MVGASARYSCLHTPVETGTPPRESECILPIELARGGDMCSPSRIQRCAEYAITGIPAAVRPQGSGYSVLGNKLTTFAFASVIIISDATRIFMTKL